MEMELVGESEELMEQYVSGVNCAPTTVREEMIAVKKRFGKEDGIVAFHGYQSFAPGECNPAMAHEIGKKLAEELWGSQYQVLIATHLDKANHLHNHFVVNSVSFLDGKRYHRTNQDYRDMRMVSDRLCKEYQLSVVQKPEQGKGKHYAEWQAEQEGKPSYHSMVKADVDEAIQKARTEKQFFFYLREKGFNEVSECSFEIKTNTEFVPVIVRTERKESSQIPDYTFVPENGIYVINAQYFAKKTAGVFENQTAGFEKLDGFGKYASGMKVFPVTAYFTGEGKTPSLTYQLWSEKAEENELELHLSPANPLIYGGQLHLGVSVNQEKAENLCITGKEYKGGESECKQWENAVLNQEHKAVLRIKLKKGLNQIEICAREAGIALERLVVYNTKTFPPKSYLGPEETRWTIDGKVLIPEESPNNMETRN